MDFNILLYFTKSIQLTESIKTHLYDIIKTSTRMTKYVLKDISKIDSVEQIENSFIDKNILTLLTSKLTGDRIDEFGIIEDFNNFNLTDKCVYSSVHSSVGEGPFHGIRYYETVQMALRYEFQRLFYEEVAIFFSDGQIYDQSYIKNCIQMFNDMALLLAWEKTTSPNDQQLIEAFRLIFDSFEASHGKIDLLRNFVSPYTDKNWWTPLRYSEVDTTILMHFDWNNPEHIKWLRNNLSSSSDGI